MHDFLLKRILLTLFAFQKSNENNNNGNELFAQRLYDPILDWKPPPSHEIIQIRQRFIEPMKSLTSPIFISTSETTGKRHQSLKCLCNSINSNKGNNNNKPILYVSNHQLVGIDSWLVVNELWETGNIVRAMTHPFLSNINNNDNDDIDGSSSSSFSLPGSSLYEKFGCLPVSPKTYYKLMKSNQQCLLFPGGAKESFHKFGEEYTLMAWSENKTDFVRMAAKFDATIIPFSSVGAAESALFLDRLSPLVAQTLNNAMLRVTPKNQVPYNARYDAGYNNKSNKNEEAQISFPMVLPKPIPSRHYYLFDNPIDLTNINHKDKQSCQTIYYGIKERIKDGCYELLEAAKEYDPYYDPLKRLPYEQFMKKQAPTFPIEVLNSR